MPKWMENMFNSSSILRYAAKQAGSTRTEGLEEMTISMLMIGSHYFILKSEIIFGHIKYNDSRSFFVN